MILVVGVMAGLTAQAYASTTYSLPGGSTDAGGHTVNASAILSLSLVGSQEVLTVILENLTPNQTSDGENITGVELNINSRQITGVALASASADLTGIIGADR